MSRPLRQSAPSREMQAVLDALAAEDGGLPDPTLLAPAEGRALAERTNRRWNVGLPDMRRIEERTFDGPSGMPIPARLLTPPDARPGLIVFVHGGGWAFCSMKTHERAARLLAIEAGVPVLTFDYRLAPEHPYPAGLEDCVALWRQVVEEFGGPASRRPPLAIAGDSAGANLALALMLHERRHGRAVPDLGLLFYGVYGADFETPSYRGLADGPGLTRAKMMRYFDWYAPAAADRADALVAPLLADDAALRALPPLHLNAAELDPLRSDSELLFARLRRLRRVDRLRVHEGVVHGFMQMTTRLAAARAATAEAGSAFREIAGKATRHETD